MQRRTPLAARRLREISKADLHAALGQTWILYHLAAALCASLLARGNSHKFVHGLMRRMNTEVSLFVLSACPPCQTHHRQYVDANFPSSRSCEEFDAERFVFDLHNAVNDLCGRAALQEEDLIAVRDHYRKSLAALGRNVTITMLCKHLPALCERYCYDCV